MVIDQDEGVNVEVIYVFFNVLISISFLFNFNLNIGDIIINGILDFEEISRYILGVEVKDGGVYTAYCNVQIDIVDQNDNVSEVMFMFYFNYIFEDLDFGSVIVFIKV